MAMGMGSGMGIWELAYGNWIMDEGLFSVFCLLERKCQLKALCLPENPCCRSEDMKMTMITFTVQGMIGRVLGGGGTVGLM